MFTILFFCLFLGQPLKTVSEFYQHSRKRVLENRPGSISFYNEPNFLIPSNSKSLSQDVKYLNQRLQENHKTDNYYLFKDFPGLLSNQQSNGSKKKDGSRFPRVERKKRGFDPLDIFREAAGPINSEIKKDPKAVIVGVNSGRNTPSAFDPLDIFRGAVGTAGKTKNDKKSGVGPPKNFDPLDIFRQAAGPIEKEINNDPNAVKVMVSTGRRNSQPLPTDSGVRRKRRRQRKRKQRE